MAKLIPNLILLIILLVSCDGNFGEQVENFVDGEVYGLSKKVARSGLERRMHEGNLVGLAEMSLEIKQIFNALKGVKVDTGYLTNSKDSKTSLAAYDHYYAQEANVLRILSDLLEAQRQREAFFNICKRAGRHDLKDLVNAEMFNMTLPKKDHSFYISNNFVEAVIENVVDALSNTSRNQQIGIMESALSKIPHKIIQQGELESIFRQECEAAIKRFKAEDLAEQNLFYIKQAKSLAMKKLETLEKAKKHVVALYYQYRTEEIYQQTGLNEVEAKRLEHEKAQKRLAQLQEQLKEAKEEFKASDTILKLENSYARLRRQAHYNRNFLLSMKHRLFTADLEIKSVEDQLKLMEMFHALKRRSLGGGNAK